MTERPFPPSTGPNPQPELPGVLPALDLLRLAVTPTPSLKRGKNSSME
jgi:hypothetical protein